MGLDELNRLSELSAGAILGIVAVGLVWALIKFLGRETSRDKQEANERANDAETERLRLEERKLSLESLTKSVEALASIGIILKTLSDDVKESAGQNKAAYETAQRMMTTITSRRDADFKEGVDNIRADIDVVPGKVGKVTEPQIDTIRKALQELEERVGKRIDESVNKFTEENQAIIRAEIEALTNHLLRKFDELTEIVPEKVSRAVLTARIPATDNTLTDTQHALITSEQRAETQAQQIDVLKKRDTGPLAETPQPADRANPQIAEPGAEGKG